ncbi:MAG: LysR family transcriptional regulator, partial [Bacillota bacterium]|nr:LysR family transcriptional regulator [Bacillota bacterium]
MKAMDLRLKLWIEHDGHMVIGEGLCRLLMLVEGTGSITGAASGMGLAYREAWGRLRQAEQAVGQPLLSRHAGGAGGGGAMLTPLARELVERFGRIRL